jgi:hypothetical protein
MSIWERTIKHLLSGADGHPAINVASKPGKILVLRCRTRHRGFSIDPITEGHKLTICSTPTENLSVTISFERQMLENALSVRLLQVNRRNSH